MRSAKVVGPGFQMPADGSLPAVVDVISVDTNTVVRSVQVHLPVHNTYVTPDDKYAVAGLRGDIEPTKAPRRRPRAFPVRPSG